ncbi:unnamed protein product [Scytosiphon promiscuus]
MTSIVTARIHRWDRLPEGFVVFNIEVSYRGSNWIIDKRFNDFVALHQGLSREFRDADLGPMPKRRFFNRFDPDFLEERSHDLQAFLGRALLRVQLTNSQAMLRFLEVAKHTNMEPPADEIDSDDGEPMAEYEERENRRLTDLVQQFQERMIDSQSVRVEPRNDDEVEARRQRLLEACNGFKDHDEHLKKYLNPAPRAELQSVDQTVNMINFPPDQKFENNIMARTMELSHNIDTSSLTHTQYLGGHGLVTSMGNI